MCAGGLASAMFSRGGDINAVNTILAPGTSIAQGVFIEMFLTAEMVFVVLMLAMEKSKDTFLAPLGIGLALLVAELAGMSLFPSFGCVGWLQKYLTNLIGVYYTGCSVNPARSLGCAVAGPSFPGYHWIYWVGPAMGALLAAGYYRFVKAMHYDEANPGQDSTGQEPVVV